MRSTPSPKRRRRGKGEGSLFERTRTLPSGTVVKEWVCVVSLGYDERGKRLRRWFTARTRGDLLLRVAQERAKHGGRIARPSGPTVAEYLESWLATITNGPTLLAYGGRIRRFVIPNIGVVRLSDLDAPRIARLYADLGMAGVSPDNIQKVHKALRRAMNLAIGQGLITRNPVQHVPRAQHRPKERPAMNAEQVHSFFAAARGNRLEAMFRLGVMACMRPGELYALAWDDLNLPEAYIDVRHNLEDTKGALALVPAKADSARRIPIDATTVALLRAMPSRSGPVFTTERGKWLRSAMVNRRHLAPILQRAGLPPMTMYSLRHTGLSLLAEAGAPPRVTSDIAGHAGIEITLDVYTHTDISQARKAIDSVNALLLSQT